MTTQDQLLEIFDRFRMSPTPIDQYESIGRQKLSEKLQTFISINQPIEFVMLGLPFKSINVRDKVIGNQPDLGEELMLKNFSNFNIQIQGFYKPGVRVTVVSDGYIFNDLLKVNDHIVEAYREICESLVNDSTTQIYDLKDFYNRRQSLETSRQKVMSQFGISDDKLEQEILMNPDTNFLYKGMMRFMEEELSIFNFPSRNQLHKEAKKLTRNMMLRNEAYSNLVRSEFQNYIRLSMHQSVNNGAKYSFKLIPGSNTVHSPWHSAVLVDGNNYETIHRKDAEQAGFHLNYQNGKPYFFTKN